MNGTQIGAYRIEAPLGEGGMGVVYRATDTKLNRPVAIKFLSEDLADASARRRFQREAQMASSLNHPHILTVYDVGEFDGPDGKWIATGGKDSQGAGLFKIPLNGGPPTRIVSTPAFNPVWSPDGELIAYAGPPLGIWAPLLAVRPDGTAVALPEIQLRQEGERYRFLPDGKSLIYTQGINPWQDFWSLDLATKRTRQLSRLNSRASMRTFDITPDGKQILFDRLRENSDIVLIDLAHEQRRP